MSPAARGEAAEYRRLGWSPIPLKERSKEPNLRELRPYLTRKATQEELGTWSWPGVGIVTGPLSGVLVLDVDGPEGAQELQRHGHQVTPMVRTASGGLHLYFKHPEQHVRTGIRVAPGLDVKAVRRLRRGAAVRGFQRPPLRVARLARRHRPRRSPALALAAAGAGAAQRPGRAGGRAHPARGAQQGPSQPRR